MEEDEAMHEDGVEYSDMSADFQMWDYSPSHRRLLFRSPPVVGREENVDLLFTGVREIYVPTLIHALYIQPLIHSEVIYADEDVRRFLLGESDEGFYVLAEDYRFERNYDDLYEAIPDAEAAFLESRQRYELAVAAALGNSFSVRPTAHPRTGPDFEITDAKGRRLFVEAKRRDVGRGSSAVRQLTMSLVKLNHRVDFGQDSLLVVLGGQPTDVANELTATLRTALGSYRMMVVPWEPGDPASALEAAAAELLHHV
jgi:hypothetical protein